jgi:UDP-GlcNAc3NAcA epimerase
MDMPEEINRILTDRISDWLFCPTTTAINNLKKEGFENFSSNIIQSGDVMEDAALFYSMKADAHSTILSSLDIKPGNFILGTIHRAENTDDLENLTNIVEAFENINQFIQVVIPLHPRTKKIMEQNQLKTTFTVIDPVGYFDMITLLKNCALVISDSGGLQKEAFFFRKYCITIREQTEWVELVDNGYNIIAGTNQKTIFESAKSLIHKPFPEVINLYGNGNACNIICKYLLR